MNGAYDAFAAGTDLSPVAARKLHERGFVVLPGSNATRRDRAMAFHAVVRRTS